MPILLLVLFGVIQLGIVFNNYVTITDAARAGARKAVVSRQAASPSSVTATAVRNSAANLDQSKLGVTVSSTWQQGTDVTVTATYPYEVSLLGLVVQSGTLSGRRGATRMTTSRRRRIGSEAGQTPSSAVFLVVLICMMAAVIDVGAWMRADRKLQADADAAALAAAQELPYDTGLAIAKAVEYGTKNSRSVGAPTSRSRRR